MLLCPLLAYVAITQLTPRYTATGTLLYDASEYKVRELQSILRVDPITDAVMASQAEVLRGMPVVEQVASRLNLLANPEFNASLRPPSWLRRERSRRSRMLFAPERRIRQRRCRAATGSRPQRHAERGAGRADRHTGEGIARAGGVVHRGRSGDRRRRGRTIAMDVYVKSQLGAKYGAVAKAQRVAGAAAGRTAQGGAATTRTRSRNTARSTAWSRACTRGSTASRSAC